MTTRVVCASTALLSALWLAGRGRPIAAAQAARTSEKRVTFNKDVAPILFEHCAPCHHAASVAPFSVLAYGDVRARASLIARVTRLRTMPPWKAEPDADDFIGMQPLTQSEIDVIQRWVDEGSLQGDPRDLPPAPRYSEGGWQLGTPDLVVRTEAYTLPPGRTDVFRIFVVPLPLSVMRYVRGIEFLPGSPSIHHANILLDRTRRSRELDERDPAPGYEGLMARTAEYPQGYFLGWTNGQPDPLARAGLSWPLSPGTDLVVALHLQPRERPEVIQPVIGFYFSESPPAATPQLLRLGRQNIDIPPGEQRYEITDAYTLPVAVDVLSLKPHAHYRARDLRATAALPDGTLKTLLHIKDWDFHWQHVYRYATPVRLPRGTTIEMRYSYDNSNENPKNPVRPAERAQWGPLSADEMGDLWMQVLAIDKPSSETLVHDFRRKWAAEDAVGYESLLAREPNNTALHDDAGVLYLELGEARQAVAHFETSARARPGSADALFNLGTALMVDGRSDRAMQLFEQVLTLNPAFAAAHTNLGNVLSSRGDVREAITQYKQALDLQPDDARAHNNLGNALMSIGQLDEAVGQLHEALRLDPRLPDAHYNLALVLEQRGQSGQATQELTNAAAAYAAGGRFDEALKAVGRAIALNPSPSVLEELRRRQSFYQQHAEYREPPRN